MEGNYQLPLMFAKYGEIILNFRCYFKKSIRETDFFTVVILYLTKYIFRLS